MHSSLSANTRFEGEVFEHEDVAHQNLSETQFVNCRFIDVNFRGADLAGVSFFNCSVRECALDGANLTRAVLGHRGEGHSRFEGCTFDASDWSFVTCLGAHFVGCTFGEMRWRDLDFPDTLFADCSFSGMFNGVRFMSGRNGLAPERNSMSGCDFTSATFRWVEFRNIPLCGTRLPAPPEHVVLQAFGHTLRRALEALEGGQSGVSGNVRVVGSFLRRELKYVADPSCPGVLAVADLQEALGLKSANQLISLLTDLDLGDLPTN